MSKWFALTIESTRKKEKAPVLDLDSGTTYEFYTPDDSGTGNFI